jgi:LmbE family N-acetylglucosaminyl deacetylase
MASRLSSIFRRRRPEPTNDELGKDGPLTAMVIFAHPDDAEFTCGGTVARWCAEGWTVDYVMVTSGDKGTHDAALSQQELAAIREQEQRDACRALGVRDVIFLGYPDGFVEANDELRGTVVRLLRQYRPDVVITWDGFRKGFNHNDHRAVGIAVRDAVYPAVRDHLYYPEDKAAGLEAHQVNEMLLTGTDEADYHVDISAHMQTKLDAVVCHASQLGGRGPEEVRKLWEERMRSSRNGPPRESFKRVSIRRPMRQQEEQQRQESQSNEKPADAAAAASQPMRQDNEQKQEPATAQPPADTKS